LGGIKPWSPDRVTHYLAGLLVCYWFYRKWPATGLFKIIKILPFVLLGSWIPDWDWIVGLHRLPLTHSALPAVMFLPLGHVAYVGMCLGVASHLMLDMVFYGNVVGIPGYWADQAFLLANVVVLVVMVHKAMKPYLPTPNSVDKHRDDWTM
jgi:hypothetical protein